MNIETGRFEKDPVKIAELVRKHNDKYAGQPQVPHPTLHIGETVVLKDLPLVVKKIKANGALKLQFVDYQISFNRADRVTIKEVEFQVTYCAGRQLGLKMVKKP